jgi:NAD-reducing hydrogenase small subunit
MDRVKFATVWLDGCSGCHMSFLDMDEFLLDIADKIDLVYSPLVDHKVFPPDVDITLVEGAVSSEEDLHKIRYIRGRTKILASFGDCAVTGNVPAMRNLFPVEEVTTRAYFDTASFNQQVPTEIVPTLLPRVRPVHQVVRSDLIIPGCPPSASLIRAVVEKLLAGEVVDLSEVAHFG